MARHSAPRNSTARHALLAATTAGVAFGAGAGAGTAAAADGAAPVVDVLRTRPTSLGKVDPRAGLKPLKSNALTGPVAQAPSSGSVPVVGGLKG